MQHLGRKNPSKLVTVAYAIADNNFSLSLPPSFTCQRNMWCVFIASGKGLGLKQPNKFLLFSNWLLVIWCLAHFVQLLYPSPQWSLKSDFGSEASSASEWMQMKNLCIRKGKLTAFMLTWDNIVMRQQVSSIAVLHFAECNLTSCFEEIQNCSMGIEFLILLLILRRRRQWGANLAKSRRL